MSEERGSWYLLTGLLIGVVLGVLYAWVLSPVKYVDTAPATLREDLKNEYRLLIAQAYAANGDTARAQARLGLLADEKTAETLTALAQQANAAGRSEAEVRALGLLAAAANAPPAGIPTAVPLTQFPTATARVEPTGTATPTQPPTATPTSPPTETPAPTLTPTETLTATLSAAATRTPTLASPTPTATFFPTATPSPTPGSPFVLDSQRLTCDPAVQGPLLVIRAVDRAGNGVPGVEIIVNWINGEEHFFTGLKPEFGPGYADFKMTIGTTYTLRLADGSQLIPDLRAEQCVTDGGQQIWGALELNFVQP
jgi:hypothetical protein